MITVHLWTQIVGKIRLAAAPPLNHLWQGCLHVMPRGLTTGSIPYGDRLFQIDLDFVGHRVTLIDSDGRSRWFDLEPMSVAAFHRRLFDVLDSVGISLQIDGRPNEVRDAIPFDQDEEHATYDPEHAQLLWRGLATAHRLLEEFRAPFIGKASPINFFWGSFDLAVSLYSGRPAPLHPGGMQNCPDWVQQEAYSREEVAAGYWPGTNETEPLFYSYAYPAPARYEAAAIEPASASFDRSLREFVLSWDAARTAPQPDAAVKSFLASTFAAATHVAQWDLRLLQPAHYPNRRPPRRAWTVVDRSS